MDRSVYKTIQFLKFFFIVLKPQQLKLLVFVLAYLFTIKLLHPGYFIENMINISLYDVEKEKNIEKFISNYNIRSKVFWFFEKLRYCWDFHNRI